MLGGRPESAEDSPGGASLRGPHRLAAVATCPRLWAYRYAYHYRPDTDTPWRFGGTLIHTCYEYLFASRMAPEDQPAWFHHETLQNKLQRQVEASGLPYEEADRIRRMALANLQAYMEAYPADAQNFRVLSIEKEYATTLGQLDPGGPNKELDAEVVTCRSDLVYENDAGIWIMDYKSHGRSRVNATTQRLTKWNDDGEYALDWQVIVNVLIVREVLGPRVRGFVIQRTTRQEPFDFDRHAVIISSGVYADAPRVVRELVRMEREIERQIAEGIEPSPRFNACYGRYGACDYRSVCLQPDKEARTHTLETQFTQLDARTRSEMRSRLRVDV